MDVRAFNQTTFLLYIALERALGDEAPLSPAPFLLPPLPPRKKTEREIQIDRSALEKGG